jgi:nucleoside 2-deoxyribosyltransferase
MRVYLSGPIEYAEDHGVGWRDQVKKAFANSSVQVIDPCDSSLELLAIHGIESVDAYHALKYGSPEDQELFRTATQSLISHDLEEVRKADLLLTKVSHVASGGTSGEITLARFLGVSVLAFCTDNIQEVSGWVQSIPDLLIIGPNSLQEAMEHMSSPEFINAFINRHRP